jgi:endonuclease-3 related protein
MGDKEIEKILKRVYRRLLKEYGPQHWWPAETPFEVIIGAILTQSTAWTNVEKALANLKASGKLAPEALRKMPMAELTGLIRPCGYYNVKARRLKAIVNFLGENFDDDLDRLFENETDALRKKLLGIYGIGEETADAILLYASGKPVFVIDAYTRRIIDRMGLAPTTHNYISYQMLFTKNLPADAKMFNEFHALFVRHAKEVCGKQPLCERCCLNLGEKSRWRKTHGRCPCRQWIYLFGMGNKKRGA